MESLLGGPQIETIPSQSFSKPWRADDRKSDSANPPDLESEAPPSPSLGPCALSRAFGGHNALPSTRDRRLGVALTESVAYATRHQGHGAVAAPIDSLANRERVQCSAPRCRKPPMAPMRLPSEPTIWSPRVLGRRSRHHKRHLGASCVELGAAVAVTVETGFEASLDPNRKPAPSASL